MNGKRNSEQGQSSDMMEVVIRWVFMLFMLLVAGLFLLEVCVRLFVKPDGADPHRGYLTPEIVHTIFGYTGGWGQAIVTFYFAKKMEELLNRKGGKDE